MSSKRHHAEVSTGGAGSQKTSSASSARRPSTHRPVFKREDVDGSSPEESKPQQRIPADDGESDASSDHPGPTRKKAEPVKSACAQCQKRKTKCSGQRPVCRFCSDRNLECSWDIGDGLTRTADLKRRLEAANVKGDELSELVGAMRLGTDQTSSMLLARLRLGDSMETLLSNIRIDEASGESAQVPLDSQMTEIGENVAVRANTEYPSPTSPEHQFNWPESGSQFHHMQQNESWMANTNPQYNQTNNQQPFYHTSNYDQPQTSYQRHDSYYPVENNAQSDTRTQDFNNTQAKNDSAPSRVTLVPRKHSYSSSAQNSAAQRRHEANS